MSWNTRVVLDLTKKAEQGSKVDIFQYEAVSVLFKDNTEHRHDIGMT